jgi:Flp pilus assembly pilin Flp
MVLLSTWAQRARVRYFEAPTGNRGASMVEYVLLIGLVALVVIAGAILLGDSLVTKFSEFGSRVDDTP